jgi:hypothetical protein
MEPEMVERILQCELFTAAERHADHQSLKFPSTATGLHLSTETYMGIRDRIPKAREEMITEVMADSILDNVGTPDITSSIDNIKIAPDLTEHQKKMVWDLVKKHRSIWERTDGVVDELEEDWMKIRIKPGASIKSRGVYRLGSRDRQTVDEVFDKLRREGKMVRSRGSPTGWGVFVVRSKNNINDKGRVVVDTRGLNAVAEDDAYLLPRQEDMRGKVKGKDRHSLLDQIKFYYQRLLELQSRYLTAVIFHRGQEEFNVLPMGYKGSPPHQQRYMDEFLLEFIEFACCYIDDILVHFRRTPWSPGSSFYENA